MTDWSHGSAIGAPPPVEHTHVHRWEGGDRSLIHAHPMPNADPLTNRMLWGTEGESWVNRPHRHVNGRHSHPHGHAEYVP